MNAMVTQNLNIIQDGACSSFSPHRILDFSIPSTKEVSALIDHEMADIWGSKEEDDAWAHFNGK